MGELARRVEDCNRGGTVVVGVGMASVAMETEATVCGSVLEAVGILIKVGVAATGVICTHSTECVNFAQPNPPVVVEVA